MKGYKYAFNLDLFNDIDGPDFFTRRPVLVVLDIPDYALRTTPKLRYSDLSNAHTPLKEFEDYYRYAATDPLSLFAKFTMLAEKFIYFVSFYRSLDCDEEIGRNSAKQNLADIHEFIHTSKCRCSEAKVVDIIGLFDGEHYNNAVSDFDNEFIYTVGSTVKPHLWNPDPFDICGGGIHYFEYPIFAILYNLDRNLRDVSNNVKKLNADFKNTYLTEELNKLEGDIRGETEETSTR